MYELKLKVWLERDGRFVVSDGRAKLLRKIMDTGSLSKAAKEMGMSYRHAWGVMHRISQTAGGDVVTSTRGGKKGGVTSLTPFGEEILREFENKVASLQSQFENDWKKPSVTADGIVFNGKEIVLIRRGKEPFKGSYALPGGFLDFNETLEHCVVREVLEETGLKTEIVDLVGVYSSPDRDPRGHFVTAVYHLRPIGGSIRAGDDAAEAEWTPLDKLPRFAFDHGKIVQDFMAKKRTKT
ncbi:MAG: NUDIX domain-containing protein [Thermoplasmata archaeon]|jgi:8-oxo-dGTP diphosphatase|nr:NUDIX domain-containing protein [Thermoplasmata archaeon]